MNISDSNQAGSAPGGVLLVAPTPPPYGGMALQARLLAKLLEEDGIAVDLLGHTQPLPAPLRFLDRLPILRTLLRAVVFYWRFWFKARHAEVVHILAASWLNFLLVVGPAVVMGRLQRKRIILNYRGGDADGFLKYFAWLAKPIFRMANFITAPSGFLAAVIERRTGVSVSIVPNIINFSIFRHRERLEFQPKMLVTRHLEEIYGVETVLMAYRHILREYPAASLWIAGTGSLEGRLRALVSTWGLSNVRFLGYLEHKALSSIYDECDILLNASQVDNFPGSLLEASASGLAIVSTNAGGIPFLYENGTNALLVEVGDWQALASETMRAIRNPALTRRLASASLELCRRCEWSSVRRTLYRVYGFQFDQENRETSLVNRSVVWPARPYRAAEE
ncbi:MAG: glycosyltransferase family 4 protein [Bryobacteraceae bacterium]